MKGDLKKVFVKLMIIFQFQCPTINLNKVCYSILE